MNVNVSDSGFSKKKFLFLIFISLLLVCAVGFRSEWVGSDTLGYVVYYNRHMQGFEFLFQFILSTVNSLYLPVGFFFSTIAFINFLIILYLAQVLVALNENRIQLYYFLLLLSACFFVSPFFFASMVNVLRQGTAIFALFVFYVVLVSRSNPLLLIAPLIIAIGFHHTSIIAIIFSPLVFMRYRVLFCSVLFAVFLYLSGLSEKLIWLVSKLIHFDLYSKISSYGGGALSGYHIGRRLDFTLFTLLAGMVFNFIGNKFLLTADKVIYSDLLKVYWVLVLPFFFFGFAAYSDRYLLAGWLFLSVLGAIFLVLLSKNKSISMRWVYCVFVVSVLYFFLKVQGIGVFKLS